MPVIDQSKNISNWINGFTKDQFDVLVKEFIRINFGADNVVLIDGPGDGGTDLKILERDGSRRKLALQITIEKRVYYKLKNDLPKIAKLIQDHDYSDSFYFFYSLSASESKLDDLFDEARSMGFNLIAFDSKTLGEYIQKPKFQRLRELIKNMLGDFPLSQNYLFDRFDKMKFDLVCYNDDSFQIKSRAIKSYILFELHLIDHGLSQEEIVRKVNEKFQIKEDQFIVRLLEGMEREKKICVVHSFPKAFTLVDEERIRIDQIKGDVEFQESYFMNAISHVLKTVGLETNVNGVVAEIYDLYKKIYAKDYLEINGKIDSDEFSSKVLDGFKRYLDKISGSKIDTIKLAKEILEICSLNDFLQKISAGELFTKMIKNVEIDQYLNRQPKSVYLDASVLIYAICNLFDPHSENNNVYFKVAKDILSYHRSGKIKLDLRVPKNYVQEAALHLQSAVHLVPFTKLSIFSKLGTASNVFYNFFLFQKKYGELEEGIDTFEDYLLKLGIDTEGIFGDDLFGYLTEYLVRLLADEDIYVFDFYAYQFKDRKKFEEIQKNLDYIHDTLKTERTRTAVFNDTMMLCELYDENVDKIDPTFLTLDNSFYHFRKKYHKMHPDAIYWYLFRPAKYLDHLALMNFQINSDALIKDIFIIMDDGYEIQHRVKYLNDVLTRVVDLKTESGIRLTKGLAEIRENEIYSINKEEKSSLTFSDSLPIDSFFIDLSKYYINKKGKYDLSKFKEFLMKEEFVDKIIYYLKEEVHTFINLETTKEKYEVFKKMDEMIDRSLNKPEFELIEPLKENMIIVKNIGGSTASQISLEALGTLVLESFKLDKTEAAKDELISIFLGNEFRFTPSGTHELFISYADVSGNRYQQLFSRRGNISSLASSVLVAHGEQVLSNLKSGS